MGKVLVVIGALLAVVGIGGAVASSLLAPSLVSLAPEAAALCRPGERLVEEGGASTYTPGQGNRRNVRMFCVDDKGARREVTGDFVQGLVGQVLGNLGGAGAFIAAFLFSLLFGLGLLLLIVGAIVSARRNARLRIASSGAMPSGTVVVRMSDGTSTTTNVAGNVRSSLAGSLAGTLGDNLAGAIEQAVRAAQTSGGAHVTIGGDLADRLRQVAEARAANLITQAEHDRLRDEILRAMRANPPPSRGP